MSVEKGLDELWVGVKGQSNWEIARAPRNVFRDSLGRLLREVELLIGCGGFIACQILTNSECAQMQSGSESSGANIRRRKGKSPDQQPRPPNTV